MKASEDPYAKLADLYDSETKDGMIQAFYREWRTYLIQVARQYKVRVRVLVDLACGTGNSTIPWTRRRSWTVVGVDRSEAMLRVARKKSRRVRWYRQELKMLALRERADLVTCHGDALNHILEQHDLQRIFFNVAGIMNEGGLFLFDLNTENWLRWLSHHEKLYRLAPNYFVAFNEYDPGRKVATFHQLWFVKRRRFFEKREVVVRERAYAKGEILRMLERAGFRPLRVKTQRKLEGKSIRELFLAQRATWI